MDLKAKIQKRKRMSNQAPFGVWTPTDFLDLGSRDAIDQALSRMASAGDTGARPAAAWASPTMHRERHFQ